MNRIAGIIFAVIGGTVSLVGSAYQTYLASPAAVAARPELVELPFWTAVFSGRFTSWAYYHHPATMTVTNFVFVMLAVLVVILTHE